MDGSRQHDSHANVKKRRAPVPLNNTSLEDLALAYVARFSTSGAKLERYLMRKLRERGWADDAPQPDAAAIVARYIERGYIDDAAYARARSASLLRRGYGARRVEQTLWHDGIAQSLREDMAPGEAAARQAALRLAQKRRFGPFGAQPGDPASLDPARREKQIAAMLRAGHPLDMARQIVDAPEEDAALQWAHEFDDEDNDDSLA